MLKSNYVPLLFVPIVSMQQMPKSPSFFFNNAINFFLRSRFQFLFSTLPMPKFKRGGLFSFPVQNQLQSWGFEAILFSTLGEVAHIFWQ